ncbi:MAG TPA: glycosyltransferase family 2 protein [Polyangia bacterium]|nr:glycosyltransferase family 2 protein [Polyangia bacterium]
MTIGACSTVKNEVDIIGPCIRNLLDQGVDSIIIADASTDGTRDILASFPEVYILDARGPWHDQERWMNQAAQMIGDAGHRWVVPFDADELWGGVGLRGAGDAWSLTLADFLLCQAADVGIVEATLWHHRDWEHKYVPAERLPKVAFRWVEGATLAVGNHSVRLPGDWRTVSGLEIRHWQYRSLEHFRRKIRGNTASLQQWEIDRGDGIHLTQYAHLTDDELEAVYRDITAQPVVFDPIPCPSQEAT